MLHPDTFEYLKPTGAQLERMQLLRESAKLYAGHLEELLPPGPDKTYCLRELRTIAMWANVAVTREQDGSPRGDWVA